MFFSQFIIKTKISLSLIITCITLDSLIIICWIQNYYEFLEKPLYALDLRDSTNDQVNVTIHNKYLEKNCSKITEGDLTFFGIRQGDSDDLEEIKNRVITINDTNGTVIYLIVILLIIFHLVTSLLPLIIDCILTCFNSCESKLKDTQKISFIRNMLVVNWVLIEPIILLATIINSITYKDCLLPQDSAFLFKNYFLINTILFFSFAIIELYMILYFLVRYRNEFPCQLLTYLIFQFIIFHTIIIYYTTLGSKKFVYILFTYKQWVMIFEISKLYYEFSSAQERFRKLRKQNIKIDQLKDF